MEVQNNVLQNMTPQQTMEPQNLGHSTVHDMELKSMGIRNRTMCTILIDEAPPCTTVGNIICGGYACAGKQCRPTANQNKHQSLDM